MAVSMVKPTTLKVKGTIQTDNIIQQMLRKEIKNFQ